MAYLKARDALRAVLVQIRANRPRVRLPAGAGPIRSVAGTRDAMCPRYAACLTVIERRRWPGFSCLACRFYGSGEAEKERQLIETAATNRCALGVG